MRKHLFSILALLCCGFMAIGLTSCLDSDDDDNSLSPEQLHQAYLSVAGPHSGKLLYYSPSPTSSTTNKVDTVATSWNISSDSIMTISRFPVSSIAPYVNNDALKEALAQVAPVTLRCYIGFTSNNPVTWLINPASPKLTLTYGGQTHTVQIGFYANSTTSFGTAQSQANKGKMLMQIIVGAIFVDGTSSGDLTNNLGYVFLAD